MRVFVLCTGRCGSTTFARACHHMTNFTVGHESRARQLFEARLAYSCNHIEVDNRLSWFLGKLERIWGQNAYYVHLTRDRDQTALSFSRRISRVGGMSVSSAYYHSILKKPAGADPLEVCRDLVDTINENITCFLADKPNKMDVRLETANIDFNRFWRWIGAEGDLQAALSEWNIRHNAAKSGTEGLARGSASA